MSEQLRDLVVSLSLNSDNFTRNLTSINRQIQEAESEFRQAASGVNGFERSVSGTESKLSMLQQKLQLQQKAVQQYERALTAAEKKLQTSADKQDKLSHSLDTAKQKNADLKDKVAAATEQYERFRRELGDDNSATIAAKENLDALKEEYAASSDEVKRLEGQLTANQRAMQNNADAVTRANTNLNNARAALRQTEAEINATTERLARIGSVVVQGISDSCLSGHDFTFYSDLDSVADEEELEDDANTVDFVNINPVDALIGDSGVVHFSWQSNPQTRSPSSTSQMAIRSS